MTNEPINDREFSAALRAIRDESNQRNENILRAMEDGFNSMRERFAAVEKDSSRFNEFTMRQAEHNGYIKSVVERAEKDLVTEKKRGDRHNDWILAGLAALVVALGGVILEWFKIPK